MTEGCHSATKKCAAYINLFRALCAVTRTRLHSLRHTCGIKRTADDVVTNAGQILDSSAPDEYGRVLLKIVSFAGNVNRTFLLVGKANSCNLSYSRVGLLGVVVVTERQTPRFCGQLSSMGDLLLKTCFSLPFLIS